MKQRWAKRVVRFAVMGIVAVAIFGFLVMSLWNWLAPAVFGLRSITFWQALGLLILSKILFGGFRGRSVDGGHWKRGMYGRWQAMTPEERKQFRQGMFSRCVRPDAAAEGSPDPRDA